MLKSLSLTLELKIVNNEETLVEYQAKESNNMLIFLDFLLSSKGQITSYCIKVPVLVFDVLIEPYQKIRSVNYLLL